MKYLEPFDLFEGSNPFKKYGSYEYYSGNKPQPGYGQFLYDFFKGMNERFKRFNDYYKSNIAATNVSGVKIDTGLGWLIGTAGDLATSIPMKIFEPSKLYTKVDTGDSSAYGGKKKTTKDFPASDKISGTPLKVPKSEADVTPEHQRLLSNNFIKNDLPNINSDSDMQNYVEKFYKDLRIKPGMSKAADEASTNMITSYYNKRSGVMPRVASETMTAGEIAGAAETSGGAEALSALAIL